MEKLFDEVYSRAYDIYRRVLQDAPQTKGEIKEFVEHHYFSSDLLQVQKDNDKDPYELRDIFATFTATIFTQEKSGLQLLDNDDLSVLRNVPKDNTLTRIEKRWLKTLLSDPFIHLFIDDNTYSKYNQLLSDIQPLFDLNDVEYFDAICSGDDIKNPDYISRFRYIRGAIDLSECIKITYVERSGRELVNTIFPKHIEYSKKNNRFRLICLQQEGPFAGEQSIYNFSQIINVQRAEVANPIVEQAHVTNYKKIICEITDNNNALERATYFFSNYRKKTVRISAEENLFKMTIYYEPREERELLIEVLSFGPTIKVVDSPEFVKLIQDKIKKQFQLDYQENGKATQY
jgi:hypothetical protein